MVLQRCAQRHVTLVDKLQIYVKGKLLFKLKHCGTDSTWPGAAFLIMNAQLLAWVVQCSGDKLNEVSIGGQPHVCQNSLHCLMLPSPVLLLY